MSGKAPGKSDKNTHLLLYAFVRGAAAEQAHAPGRCVNGKGQIAGSTILNPFKAQESEPDRQGKCDTNQDHRCQNWQDTHQPKGAHAQRSKHDTASSNEAQCCACFPHGLQTESAAIIL